jgi:hypothetical protein
MGRRFAGGRGAVMAGRARSGGYPVMGKFCRCPGICRMARVASARSRQVSARLASRRLAVMAGRAAPRCHTAVAERRRGPARGLMAGVARFRGR